MTRLEELEILIKNKEDIYNEKCSVLQAASKEQEEIIRSAFLNLFVGFINGDGNLNDCDRVRVVMSIYSSSVSGHVDIVDKEGKDIFGADIDFYFDLTYYSTGKPKLSFNTGTCGSFGKDDEGQILKYKAMAILVNNFDVLTEVLINALDSLKDAKQESRIAEKELDKLQFEKDGIIRKIEDEKIRKSIQAGNYYKNTHYSYWKKNTFFKGRPTAKIASITDKSVNLIVGFILSNSDDETKTRFEGWDTYRMKRDEFFRYVKSGVFQQVPEPTTPTTTE